MRALSASPSLHLRRLLIGGLALAAVFLAALAVPAASSSAPRHAGRRVMLPPCLTPTTGPDQPPCRPLTTLIAPRTTTSTRTPNTTTSSIDTGTAGSPDTASPADSTTSPSTSGRSRPSWPLAGGAVLLGVLIAGALGFGIGRAKARGVDGSTASAPEHPTPVPPVPTPPAAAPAAPDPGRARLVDLSIELSDLVGSEALRARIAAAITGEDA